MRSIGRRKSDKYRTLVGMVLGAVLTSYALYTASCDGEGGTTVTGPSNPVVAATPIPAPAPAPTTPAESPAPSAPTGLAFTLTAVNPSTIHVDYNGEASRAEVDTWYTSFDNQDLPFAIQHHVVERGGTIVRAYNRGCIQADADQPGVKMIGGVWFDKDQRPFDPRRNPEKIVECRTTTFDCASVEPPALLITGSPTRVGNSFTGIGSILPLGGTFSLGFPVVVNAENPLLELVYTIVQTYGPTQQCTRVVSATFSLRYECVEDPPNGLYTPTGELFWFGQEPGRCPVGEDDTADYEDGDPNGQCHVNGEQPTHVDFDCQADVDHLRTQCKNVTCSCVEREEPIEILGTPTWEEPIMEGRCEFNDEMDLDPEGQCHQDGSRSFTNDWLCKADETTTQGLCRNVTCPQTCQPPFDQTVALNGPLGNPTTECSYFGNFVPAGDGDPSFYISKCGQSTYVTSSTDSTPNCPAGPGLGYSHTTACKCGPVLTY